MKIGLKVMQLEIIQKSYFKHVSGPPNLEIGSKPALFNAAS